VRRTTTTAAAAVVLIPLLVCAVGSPALAADSGDVAVTNTETVQARLSATGAFRDARVYDQLALSGHGTTTVTNPVSTKGLRNLDGFGGYTVVDGKLVTTLSVDGERRERSLSTYDKDLPLSVEVTYTFDGKPVQPGAVVGKSGTLGVHYKVVNQTGKTQDVTYDDGTGTQATASAQTVIPMIGQLVTVLPSTFTDVQSDEAGIAGDGHGGTRMQFQMTLFPPIGSDTAEFGYTAKVSHAVVPKANLTSMAVSPLDYPSFKGGAESYKSGAQKGVDLTSGAIQIDDSVLQLHDGAAQLLAGLLQLRDGAAQLKAGLNDSAVPGAHQLADGLTKDAAPGAAQLAAGAKQLDDGLAQAQAKAPQLLSGLTQVNTGLAGVDAGLAKMYGDIGTLPAQAQPLHDGIAALRAAIGTTTTPSTLLAGVDQLRQGITGASGSASTIAAGSVQLGTQLETAIAALTSLRPGMNPAYQPTYDSVLTQLSGGVPVLKDTADPATIAGGATALSSGLAGAAGNLTRVECGLSAASLPGVCDTTKPGVLEGLAGVDAGVTALVGGVVAKVQGGVGVATDSKPTTLRGGIHSLQAGTGQLSAGGDTLASGLAQLGAGAGRLNDGAGDLSVGIAKAAAGSRALSDGLADAADGSTQLSDGLNTAAEGAPQLVDGTQQLSDEGTSQVVASGQDTAEDFGVKYAVLSAGAERASTEGMAYGAPEGAAGSTAYSIDIAGVDDSGVSALGRFIAAIALFAGGIGLATFARRRFL
jgi:putative membrane protein